MHPGGVPSRSRYEALSHTNPGVLPAIRFPSRACRYIENAAFNPSLPPLQAAIIMARGYGVTSFDDIDLVVLAERDGSAGVSQEAGTRELLRLLAPEAAFLPTRLV